MMKRILKFLYTLGRGGFNSKKILFFLSLLYSNSALSQVYKFSSTELAINSNGVAIEIPSSVPASSNKRLLYLRSNNELEGVEECINLVTYIEEFITLSPNSGIIASNCDNHYFVLIDSVRSNQLFKTNLFINNNSVYGSSLDELLFTDAQIGRIVQYPENFFLINATRDCVMPYSKNIWWGISPNRPTSFSISINTNDNGLLLTSKSTEGEKVILKFQDLITNQNNFNIEKSLDNGFTWTQIATNVKSGYEYTVDSYSDINYLYPDKPGVKKLIFRVKTYFSSNALVGTSSGYLTSDLEVYPIPVFSINSVHTYCHGTSINKININNISANESIFKLKLDLFIKNNPNPIDNLEIEPSKTSFPLDTFFNTQNLVANDYIIIAQNFLKTINNEVYPCGQISKEFNIKQIDDLSTFFIDQIAKIDCQKDLDTILVLANPLNREILGNYTFDDINLINLDETGKIKVPYPYDSVKVILKYKTGLECPASKEFDGFYIYPKLDFTAQVIQPICYDQKATVSINSANIDPYFPEQFTYNYRVIPESSNPPVNEGFKDILIVDSLGASGNYIVQLAYDKVNEKVCPADFPISVNIPDEILFTSSIFKNLSVCDSAKNGTVRAENFQNAFFPITLKLFKEGLLINTSTISSEISAPNKDFTNLGVGNYYVEVIDSKGCKNQNDVLSLNPVANPFKISNLVVTDPLCYNPNNSGSIILKTEGEGSSSTYAKLNNGNWSTAFNGVTGKTYSNLSGAPTPGLNYFVFARPGSLYQCADTINTKLVQPISFSIDLSYQPPTCSNNKGIITLNGANKYYQKSGTSWNLVSSIISRSPGTYTFRGESLDGCISNEISISVESIPVISIVHVETINPRCHGEYGKYRFKIEGGSGGENVIFLNNVTLADDSNQEKYYSIESGIYTINGLPEDSYQLRIVQDSYCSANVAFTIDEPNPVYIIYEITDPIDCYGQNAKLKVNIFGGTPSYTITNTINNQLLTGNTFNFELVPAGKYYFTAYDSRGCSSGNFSYSVYQPQQLILNIPESKIDKPTCNGYSDGSFEAEMSGGISPYTLFYGKDFNNLYPTPLQKVSNLNEGIYYCKVVDDNGCYINNDANYLKSFLIDAPDPINILIDGTENPKCSGDSSGSISFTLTGRENQLKTVELWKGGEKRNEIINTTSDNIEFSDLEQGLYNIIFYDSNSCTVEKEFQITEPSQLTYTLSSKNVICKGDSNGEFTMSIEGGSPIYQHKIYKEDELYQDLVELETNNKTISSLTKGNYSVFITDKNGCDAINLNNSDAIIEEPEDFLDLNVTSTPVRCYGESNGSITAEASNGWGNYSYSIDSISWNNTSNSITYNDLPQGHQRIYLRDNGGCLITKTSYITQPEPLRTDTVLVKPVNCFGGNDGEVIISLKGGNGNYSIKIEGDTLFSSNTQRTGLQSNNYNFKFCDTLGCIDSSSVFIPQPTLIRFSKKELSNYNDYNIKCFSETDSAFFKIDGGFSPYTFMAMDSLGNVIEIKQNLFNNDFYLENLSSGKYHLQITDSNNCLNSDSLELIQPKLLTFDTIFLVEPRCFGVSDGFIEIPEMKGGVADFNFMLKSTEIDFNSSKTGKNAKFTNLSAGTYSLFVSDNNGCSTFKTVLLQNPQPLVVNFAINPIICKGDSTGNITSFLSGGTGIITPYWFTSDSILISNENGLNNIPSGEYLFTAFDYNGCTVNDSLTGNKVISLFIPEPESKLNIKEYVIEKPSCYGNSNGSIKVTASGGWGNYKYSIDSEGIVFDIINEFDYLRQGDYKIWVRDSLSCLSFIDINIDEPDSLVLTANYIKNISCFGENSGEVQLSATGGNSNYLFYLESNTSNENGLFQDLSKGDYNFRVTDEKGCTSWLDTTIFEPSQIGYYVKSFTRPICGGNQGELEVVPTGGVEPYSIQWINYGLPNSTYINNLSAGRYRFRITDSNGCEETFRETLSDIDGPSIEITKIISPTCDYRNDGKIDFLITGGTEPITIEWEGNSEIWEGNSSIENLAKGEYLIEVIDKNGCYASEKAFITAPTKISYIISSKDVDCYNTSTGWLQSDITGGSEPYSLQWYNSDFEKIESGSEIQFLKSGNYYLSIIDYNRCGINSDADTLSNEIKILQPQFPLQIELNRYTEPLCQGDSNATATLKSTGGWGDYQFSIDSVNYKNDPVFKNLSATKYRGFVKDKVGCTSFVDYHITEPNQLNTNSLLITDVACFGDSNGSTFVKANGGSPPYFYSIDNGTNWSTQSYFFSLSKGIYNVLSKDDNGCKDTLEINISEPEELNVDIFTLNPTYCGTANGKVELIADGGTAPYWVKWSHIDKPWGLSAFNLPEGTVNATVYDDRFCNKSISAVIPELEGPKITKLETIDSRCSDSSDGEINIDFVGTSRPFTFFLNGIESSTAHFEGLSAGKYTFCVVDKFNCSDYVTINLAAPDPLNISFPTVKNPLCFGYSNGLILTSVEGGTKPYQYIWSNGTTDSLLNNIPAGDYHLEVTDHNSCVQNAAISIFDPEKLTSNLPEEVSLCQGQSIVLDAGNVGCQYWWTSTNGFESFEKEVTLTEGGEYYLMVTNDVGCFTKDTITVKKFNHTVDATLLLPSNANLNDTIVVVDISWPIPDSLFWVVPSEFTMLLDSPYEKHLRADKLGIFDIALITYVGECSAFNLKSIEIFENPDPVMRKYESTDIIKNITIAPNPASYSTWIKVELTTETDIIVEFFNGFGIKTIGRSLSGSTSYSLQLPLYGLMGGMYMIKVTANNSYRTVKLVVE